GGGSVQFNGGRAAGGGGVASRAGGRRLSGRWRRCYSDGNGSGGPDGPVPAIGLGRQGVCACRQTVPGPRKGVPIGSGGTLAQGGGAIEEHQAIDACIVADWGGGGGGIGREVGWAVGGGGELGGRRLVEGGVGEGSGFGVRPVCVSGGVRNILWACRGG